MSRTISLLDRVRIASPCSVPWASMSGDAKVRHCGQCQHNVYNVVEMKRGEAEALIREREGDRVCLRLHQRRDGTVITKDCPTGVAAARKRLAKMMGGFAAAIAVVGGIGLTVAGRAEWGLRLRDYEPFARLTQWLDPPATILRSICYQIQDDPNRRILGPASEPVFPFMANGNPSKDKK